MRSCMSDFVFHAQSSWTGHEADKRVSMGWWLLRLSAKILNLLRLSVNFFSVTVNENVKINFFCFKELNINKLLFLYL